MDDKLNSLDRLIEAVGAGEISKGVTGLKSFEQFSRNAFGLYQSNAAWRAYGGSLDAALALHEALLPGWAPGMSKNVHHGHWFAWVQNKDREADATSETPARSLLLAILRAYRSVQA